MKETIPTIQNAIQLVGADKLVCNSAKEVDWPGPYQILAQVEAVGLCFSDLKLLKQFDKHARKSEVISGIDRSILLEIPSYKPGSEPTVPGHEAFCRIISVGDKVTHHKAGQLVLVQTDYRWLKTAGSNSAFGYNFEGALQQYVLMDERVIVEPESGESFLIPVEKDISSSAIALVEPWACVESSYITEERKTVLPGGRLLIAADKGRSIEGIAESFSDDGKPASITVCLADERQIEKLGKAGVEIIQAGRLDDIAGESYDDIIYFGSDKEKIDLLNDKLAAKGIINIVLGGQKIGLDVSVGVGRVHYGLTRWIGTTGNNAAVSYKNIPCNGEIRENDRAIIIGAAGPMGQMHVIRLICSGVENISVFGTDLDDDRLNYFRHKAVPIAKENGVPLFLVNPQKKPLQGRFSYFAVMAPVGALVAQAVKDSGECALINIFAGIPAGIKQNLDLDTYIANRCFMFGTSGSRLSDMKIVLEKLLTGRLDTNCIVDAVCGMAGAIDGIRAVENRTLAGKIIVYPQLKGLPLVPLSILSEKYPSVAEKLDNGIWTKEAEDQLLKTAK